MKCRILLLGMLVVANPLASVADLAVSDVEVFSGWPWQEVVIGYTITGFSNEPRSLSVIAKDNLTGKTYEAQTLNGVGLSLGRHIIKWNASADDAKFKSHNVDFTVEVVKGASGTSGNDLYCVIDLSGGVSASYYPISSLDSIPQGGWSDEYKTTKLVLRRIEAGEFTMGSEKESDENKPHKVVLTQPFYIGVFAITQRQWELVMGNRPSYFNNTSCYATRPVEKVSYNMIRGSTMGARWPKSSEVDADSFIGKIQAKTGLSFDLPTEAQWEYACRAGTLTDYNNGTNYKSFDQDDNMDMLGRYNYNGGGGSGSECDTSKGTSKVGSFPSNSWGLYDMHGNVAEWCLDWYGNIGASTDPKGATSSSVRVLRGGYWGGFASHGSSSCRFRRSPSSTENICGIRLSRTFQE